MHVVADTSRQGGSGSGYDVLRKMKLTNVDQEQVAKAIAGDKEESRPGRAGLGRGERDKVGAWLQ
jgi:hypothetical protein